MKNYIKPGNTLSLLAPYDVLAGGGFKVGSIIAIAATDALNGAAVEGNVQGCFTVAKADSQAWAVGDKVYWDNAAKNFTTTAGGNTLAGVAITANAATAGIVLGDLLLNGSF